MTETDELGKPSVIWTTFKDDPRVVFYRAPESLREVE